MITIRATIFKVADFYDFRIYYFIQLVDCHICFIWYVPYEVYFMTCKQCQNYCLYDSFLWNLDLCKQSAFLVGHIFWQNSQIWPGLDTCLDSMWYCTLCLYLLVKGHSRQKYSPFSLLDSLVEIRRSREPKQAEINVLMPELFISSHLISIYKRET